MDKFRKAIAGGVSGGIAAVATGFVFVGLPTKEQVVQLIGIFAGGFVVGFVAVYQAPANAVRR